MITRISGTLTDVSEAGATVALGGLSYELALPSGLVTRLVQSRPSEQQVTFHTLYYIEAGDKRAALFPKLIGFDTPIDREFFHLLTQVQGMGVRKALKALTISSSEIASAIELKQTSRLAQLPGIGKKMAERIVTELHGKAAKFALARLPAVVTATTEPGSEQVRDDVLHVLDQLQYGRTEAEAMIDEAVAAGVPLSDVESFLQQLFRRKQSR